MIRIAVLDDYQKVARSYADWASLGPDVVVDVFDAPMSVEEAAIRLAGYDVLCLMRERLPLPGSLIAQLPALKLVIVTGGRTRVIDFEAAVAQGITVCHTSAGESEHATPELAWALLLRPRDICPKSIAGCARAAGRRRSAPRWAARRWAWSGSASSAAGWRRSAMPSACG